MLELHIFVFKYTIKTSQPTCAPKGCVVKLQIPRGNVLYLVYEFCFFVTVQLIGYWNKFGYNLLLWSVSCTHNAITFSIYIFRTFNRLAYLFIYLFNLIYDKHISFRRQCNSISYDCFITPDQNCRQLYLCALLYLTVTICHSLVRVSTFKFKTR